MESKKLNAPDADKGMYKIVATDRTSDRRVTVVNGLTASAARAWQPRTLDKRYWKYFKVSKA